MSTRLTKLLMLSTVNGSNNVRRESKDDRMSNERESETMVEEEGQQERQKARDGDNVAEDEIREKSKEVEIKKDFFNCFSVGRFIIN
ncbi:hypothetical protein RUM44_000270 [Polyplax serrata]|uniref:Uncharacterized protein n=1 Tax=Polyplax serrata TaxID=468196 RepID=A0ABR1B6E3_POLSC